MFPMAGGGGLSKGGDNKKSFNFDKLKETVN